MLCPGKRSEVGGAFFASPGANYLSFTSVAPACRLPALPTGRQAVGRQKM